jgi:hypothetical protein
MWHQRRQPLTSAREATAAALGIKPPQRGTSGVSPIAALHAAARPQRSRMARAPARGERAAEETSTLPEASSRLQSDGPFQAPQPEL